MSTPPSPPTPQDWSEVLKGATPEAVAEALLQPRKPLKQPGKATGAALTMADRRPGLWHWVAAQL